MRISRTALSCPLHPKGYVTALTGSAFGHDLLHLFQPSSAFALGYILRLRSCRLLGAFLRTPLPPGFGRSYAQEGPLALQALPCFLATTDPAVTLSSSAAFPVGAGYTTYLPPSLSRWDEEGFSSCSTRPCHRAVALTPPECRAASVSMRRGMLPSPLRWRFGLRGYALSGSPLRSLTLRPGDSLTMPSMALWMGFRRSVSLAPAIVRRGC
jgi:hypothetical protein